jgi:LCP family protein required for cell wall assembly
MKSKYWLRIGGGLILWTIVIGLFLIYRPLGPGLPPVPATPSPQSPDAPPAGLQALQASDLSVASVGSEAAAIGEPTPSITLPPASSEPTGVGFAANGVCGETGSMTFLILGESSPEDNPPHGADAIRLAKVDFDHQQIHILGLPPTLWVTTSSLASQGLGGAELTTAYYESKQLTPGSEQEKMSAAVAVIAQALEANFGFTPDHYLDVKETTFADALNALGGIDITLPSGLDGRPEGFEYFPAGSQHLNGSQALDFVRILQPAGAGSPDEWQRMGRQDLALQALRQALISPQNWTKIPALVGIFQQDILTDLSVRNILDLACLMNQPGIQIQEEAVDPTLSSQGAGGELVPNTASVAQFIASRVGK